MDTNDLDNNQTAKGTAEKKFNSPTQKVVTSESFSDKAFNGWEKFRAIGKCNGPNIFGEKPTLVLKMAQNNYYRFLNMMGLENPNPTQEANH